MQGDADDKARSGAATPIDAFEREGATYSQVPDVEERSAQAQRMFNQETPLVKDDASDINRSKLASEQMYHERSGPIKSIGDDHSRLRDGTAQEFFQNDEGKYGKELSAVNQTGYAQEFFKNDEAIRADISSQDKSAVTAQNYFENVEDKEFGKPDDFMRNKHETA